MRDTPYTHTCYWIDFPSIQANEDTLDLIIETGNRNLYMKTQFQAKIETNSLKHIHTAQCPASV